MLTTTPLSGCAAHYGPPTVIDLFSGAGGFSLGFRAAGCHILAAADADETAAETYRHNLTLLQPNRPPRVFGGTGGNLDTLALDDIAAGECPDIVIGGPPCQAFSLLGRAKLDSLSDEGFQGDPRNILYRRFLAAVERWQPRAAVMENVSGMLSVAGVNYADTITGELAELGYRTGYALLNAVWYGVPQFRERLFFIGFRSDLPFTPAAPPTGYTAELPDGYAKPLRRVAPTLQFGGVWDLDLGQLPVTAAGSEHPAVTVGEALDDLPVLTDHLAGGRRPPGKFRTRAEYRSPPHSEYARMMREWPGFAPLTGIDDHVVRRTPRDYETFRRMHPGDRFPEGLAIALARFDEELGRRRTAGTCPEKGSEAWKALRKEIVPPYKDGIFPDKWRKLMPNRPSWTVPAHLAKDSYSHIHHDSAQARTISVREAARLQSFPDAFAFCGNMGDCFRQIGNAVPPLLGLAVARAVLSVLSTA